MEFEEMSEEDNMPVFVSESSLLKGHKVDNDYPDVFEDISEEEKEDYTIKSSDAMIVGAKV